MRIGSSFKSSSRPMFENMWMQLPKIYRSEEGRSIFALMYIPAENVL